MRSRDTRWLSVACEPDGVRGVCARWEEERGMRVSVKGRAGRERGEARKEGARAWARHASPPARTQLAPLISEGVPASTRRVRATGCPATDGQPRTGARLGASARARARAQPAWPPSALLAGCRRGRSPHRVGRLIGLAMHPSRRPRTPGRKFWVARRARSWSLRRGGAAPGKGAGASLSAAPGRRRRAGCVSVRRALTPGLPFLSPSGTCRCMEGLNSRQGGVFVGTARSTHAHTRHSP